MAQQQQLTPSQNNAQNNGPMMDDDMIGAIKIKDALFIGDEFAAQDLEFVVANKVTHIINCAGKQVPNHWEPIGVTYLTFFWFDQENQILFDAQDETTNKIFDFIDGALSKAESVLVHSVRGQSRSSCVIAAYIMRKYKWSLLKTLEFLNSRRPDLEIRATFIHQLSAYEARLHKTGNGPKTQKWTEISEENCFLESEELLLRNTFLNAQMGPIAQFNPALLNDTANPNQRLRWIDEFTQGKELLGQEGDPFQDLCMKDTVEDITIHREINPNDVRTSMKVPVCSHQVMKHYPSLYYQNPEHMGKLLSHTAPSHIVPGQHVHNQQEKAMVHLQQQQVQQTSNQQPIQQQQKHQQSNSQSSQSKQQTNSDQYNFQQNTMPPGFQEQKHPNPSSVQHQFQMNNQLMKQNNQQSFHPKIDESVHSEDLSELNTEIVQQNNRQSVQKKSINNIGGNPSIGQNMMQQQQQPQQNKFQQQQLYSNGINQQNNFVNPSQLLIQDQQQQFQQQQQQQRNPVHQQQAVVNQQQQQPIQQNHYQLNAEAMRKNLEEQRKIHQMATSLGANQSNVHATTQMQQVQPNVTNIINNNNINNFFIQNPPIEMIGNQQKQVQLNQRFQQIGSTANSTNNMVSKQRSGSARPAQNIHGDADPLGPNSIITPINNNNTQILNTDNSDMTQNQQQNPLSNQKPTSNGNQISIKKKRGDSPSVQNVMNKYGGNNVAAGTQNMYQQLQNQIKTQQNRILSQTNNGSNTLKSANGFGSARAGQSNGSSQSKGNGNNKLNSFRGGGPIRATQMNGIDNPNQIPIQINQSAVVKLSAVNGSHQQRPNSSKPIIKSSYNHELSNTNELTNNMGPLTQIVNENQQLSSGLMMRPNSSGQQRPSSPGTGKIVKASLGDSQKSSSIKGKPRMRSASPAGSTNNPNNNSQTNNNINNSASMGLNYLNKSGNQIRQIAASSISKQTQPLGQRLQGVMGVGVGTANIIGQMGPSTKHVPQLYMRGYSPSKPKWKN
eukprot:403330790